MEKTAKIKQLQKCMKEKKIDHILLINTSICDPNVRYFTTLDLEYSFLLIPQKKQPVYLVSALEEGRAKQYSAVSNVKKFKQPLKELAKIIKQNKK